MNSASNEKNEGMTSEDYSKKQESAARLILLTWRSRRIAKKALKRNIVRCKVISELLKTEKTYVSKLQIINGGLRSGLLNHLKSEANVERLLSNVQQIEQLSVDQFLKYLKEKTQNLRFKSRVFDRGVLNIIPFFKIYSDYLQSYDAAMKYFDELLANHKEIAEFISTFETQIGETVSSLLITPVQRLPRYRLLFTELVKLTPVDHFDYVFIQQCLKAFEGVCAQVNSSIQKYLDNQKIFELAHAFNDFNVQLIERRSEFITEEKLGVMIGEGEKDCVVSFLNNVILIQERVDEVQARAIGWLALYPSSLVRGEDDMKYYKHIFKVSGENNSFTMMAESQEHKARVIALIEKTIRAIPVDRNSDGSERESIHVSILGTEEWNSTKIQKFTVYIVEVKIEHVVVKIWVRNSQLVSIEKKIRAAFKDIDILHLTSKFIWLSSHTTRAIESRKIQFVGFIQQILKSKRIRNSPLISEILSDLGLPLDFYSLPSKQSPFASDSVSPEFIQMLSGSKNSSLSVSTQSDLQGLKQSSQQQHLNGSSLKLSCLLQPSTSVSCSYIGGTIDHLSLNAIGQLSASEVFKLQQKQIQTQNRYSSINSVDLNSTTLSESIAATSSKKKRILCQVPIVFVDNSSIQIEISAEMRSYEACELIGQTIQLQFFSDHRLCLEDASGNARVLDEEEILFKALFPSPENLATNAELQKSTEDADIYKYKTDSENIANQSLFAKLFRPLKQTEEYKIVFKKYLWLSATQEEFDIRRDPVRLRLICYQIFSDAQHSRFKLRFLDYALLAALYLYINAKESQPRELLRIQQQQNFELLQQQQRMRTPSTICLIKEKGLPIDFFESIRAVIPETILEQKTEIFWIEEIMKNMDSLTQQIDTIHKQNSISENEKYLLNENDQSADNTNLLSGFTDATQHTVEEEATVVSQNINENHNKKIDESAKRDSHHDENGDEVEEDNQNQHGSFAQFTELAILLQKAKLMQLVVINAIKVNSMFGVTQFYVNTYKDTLKIAQEMKLGIKENAWLGIRYDMLMILGPELKEELYKVPYQNLKSIRVFPKLIQFEVLSLASAVVVFKFNTSQSYEISQLVQRYQSIIHLANHDHH